MSTSQSTPDAYSRRGSGRPAMLWLGLVAVALLVATFLAPMRLASVWPGGGYSDISALSDSLSSAFVRFWSANDGVIASDLAEPVEFWARFHIAKALLAGLLLLVLFPLGARAWNAFWGARSWRRLSLGVVELGVAIIAPLALVVLVANLQGAIAPLTSALGLLPVGAPDPSLAPTVRQVRRGLIGAEQSPPLDTLLHDFTLYHAAMAGLGVVVIAGLLGSSVFVWRRRRGATQAQRHVLAMVIAGVVALTACFLLVTAANISTAVWPAPALLGFFEGGQ